MIYEIPHCGSGLHEAGQVSGYRGSNPYLVKPTEAIECQNMDYSQLGIAKKASGYGKMTDSALDGAVTGVFYGKNTNGAKRIIAAGEKLYHHESGDTFTEIKTGLDSNKHYQVSFSSLNDLFLITNGRNFIQQWNGSAASTSDITGNSCPNRAAYLIEYWNRVFALNTREDDTSITITDTTIAFVDNDPSADTITDSGSGFVAAGFVAGQVILVSGTTNNNGYYTIDTVAAGTITLIATDELTAESAGSSFTITKQDDCVERVRWSKIGGTSGGPLYWGGPPGGGFADLVTRTSEAVNAGKVVGRNLALTKENSLWTCAYTGDPNNPFVFDILDDEVGNIAPHSLAGSKREAYFLSENAIMKSDGTSKPVPISSYKIENTLGNLNRENLEYAVGCYDEYERKYNLIVPLVGEDNSLWLTYSENSGNWSKKERAGNAMGIVRMGELTLNDITWTLNEMDVSLNDPFWTGNRNEVFWGDYDGHVYWEGVINSHAGSAIDGYHVFRLVLPSPEVEKRILWIEADFSFSGSYDIEWDVKADNAESWTSLPDMSMAATTGWIPIDISGKYFEIRVRNQNISEPFELLRCRVEYETLGKR